MLGDQRNDGVLLSSRVRRVVRAGAAGFVLANLAVGLAFLTNVEPMPYWPWLSLSSAPLPAQPRLGHYPVSYTLGLWLWEFTFPFAILLAADRLSVTTDRGRRVALVALPAVVALAFHAYCRFLWAQPTPTVWEPAVTAVCYVYCQTYAPLWSGVTIGTGLVGLTGATLARDSAPGRAATAAFGVLAFPLGIVALYELATRPGDGRGVLGARSIPSRD